MCEAPLLNYKALNEVGSSSERAGKKFEFYETITKAKKKHKLNKLHRHTRTHIN